MRAIAIDEYGGSERLQLMELPIPEVGPNDVLIRVRSAGVNPADISIREGRYAQMMPLTFPAIMGSDFAGTVAQVGAHVTTVRPETQVYGISFGGGTYAEYLRSLGAAETVDFTRGDVVEAVRTSHPGGVDAVMDVVSGSAAIGHVAQALRTGGRLLSTIYAVDPAQFAERGITAVNVVRPRGAEMLDRLSGMVEAGELRVPVQETLSLEEAARAQEMLQHGHLRGKLVLTVA